MDTSLYEQIRTIVSRIPEGKVATYGQIASLAGTRDARIVGWAMRGNQNPNVPCHRVIKKDGFLAENYSLGTWIEQKRRLLHDGVTFIKENQVDIGKHQWKP